MRACFTAGSGRRTGGPDPQFHRLWTPALRSVPALPVSRWRRRASTRFTAGPGSGVRSFSVPIIDHNESKPPPPGGTIEDHWERFNSANCLEVFLYVQHGIRQGFSARPENWPYVALSQRNI